MNKKAMIGDSLLMILRLFLISFAALIILGTILISYSPKFEISTAENIILSKNLVNCIAPNGKIQEIPEEYHNKIMEYCNYSENQIKRYLVKIELKQNDETKETLTQDPTDTIDLLELTKEYKEETFEESMHFTYEISFNEEPAEINIIILKNEK